MTVSYQIILITNNALRLISSRLLNLQNYKVDREMFSPYTFSFRRRRKQPCLE